jgi:hypothetical protein
VIGNDSAAVVAGHGVKNDPSPDIGCCAPAAAVCLAALLLLTLNFSFGIAAGLSRFDIGKKIE